MLHPIDDIISINQYKKPEHIIALRSYTVNQLIEKHSNKNNDSHFIKNVNLNTDFFQHDIFIAQRDYLEYIPFFRQPIFYMTLEHKGKFGLYRRKSEGGDSRLDNKCSIGFGGHVDLADVVHENSVIDLEQTIALSASRELEEEIYLPIDNSQYSITTNGYIINNSDEVSMVHIGVWQSIKLPNDFDITQVDIHPDEAHKMEFLGFFTPEELKEKNKTYNMEAWTQDIINNL